MDYKALYRQWRPQTFTDVVGQEHITRTVKNAITNDRIAHAYLFCGPRGTGKTSTAKIIGKSVNCIQRQGVEPCNQCETCNKINTGSSMDVQEIDAASNRGIEEIRDLREKVKYAPSEGKYKVYIIDEVHMLTTEAFNALLKTLEEPPEHVIFILATTEPHKIPATILSRCQRFDFRRIGSDLIKERLYQVVATLGIKIEDEAVSFVAKVANGGLRDALSILDQCAAYSESENITITDVTDVLGTVTQDIAMKMAQLIIDQDVKMLLELVTDVVNQGKDPQLLLQDLMEHFRNIMLLQVCEDPGTLIALPEDVVDGIRRQAINIHRIRLQHIIDTFANTEGTVKWSSNPQLMLELGLLKAVDFQPDFNVEMLSGRIAALENGRATGTAVKDKKQRQQETMDKSLPPASGNIGLETIKQNWQKIMKTVKKANISTYAFLVEAEVVSVEKNLLTLGYASRHNFHREKMAEKEHRNLVMQILKTAFGQDIEVKCCQYEIEKDKNNSPKDVLKKAQDIFGSDKIEETD